ncbi:hypothetical protein HYDPIDRAFT_108071 [Hydnomerulius pinastri MD-312]|nr:hypothetical protein HYDPIDRAFT_108071 [Hydnomerulius pinastri MD-312]
MGAVHRPSTANLVRRGLLIPGPSVSARDAPGVVEPRKASLERKISQTCKASQPKNNADQVPGLILSPIFHTCHFCSNSPLADLITYSFTGLHYRKRELHSTPEAINLYLPSVTRARACCSARLSQMTNEEKGPAEQPLYTASSRLSESSGSCK